jgi:hypothetical protein
MDQGDVAIANTLRGSNECSSINTISPSLAAVLPEPSLRLRCRCRRMACRVHCAGSRRARMDAPPHCCRNRSICSRLDVWEDVRGVHRRRCGRCGSSMAPAASFARHRYRFIRSSEIDLDAFGYNIPKSAPVRRASCRNASETSLNRAVRKPFGECRAERRRRYPCVSKTELRSAPRCPCS